MVFSASVNLLTFWSSTNKPLYLSIIISFGPEKQSKETTGVPVIKLSTITLGKPSFTLEITLKRAFF
ncbi:hypothetical protein D3C84_1152130 [compost metagenome]